MNSESNVLPLLLEHTHDFSHRVLALGHSQSVAGDNDDVLGVDHALHGIFNLPFRMCSSDLHGLAWKKSDITQYP